MRQSNDTEDRLYTFKAVIERVVDGDTLIAHIDLGFDMWIQERVRLRGINTEEVGEMKGDQAKRFVVETLKKVKGIVLKTYRPDKYGRYLADVFYSTKESDSLAVADKGNFLNQELLDNGWAVVYKGETINKFNA